MEEIENDDKPNKPATKEELSDIYQEIKNGYMYDRDATDSMKKLVKIIESVLEKEKIEDYFKEDKEAFDYFIDSLFKGVIQILMYQQTIIGDEGGEIALNLFLNIFKLFLKFHKNNEYATLFERIRTIFNKGNFFNAHKYDDEEIKYNMIKFNSDFCSDFAQEKKQFEIGDEIDFIYDDREIRYDSFKKVWMRGRIKDVTDKKYIVEYFDVEDLFFPINSVKLAPKDTKISDWDWRLNLKKYDVIDCFDRNRWYPATVLDRREIYENNGYKKIVYRIAFRLYTEHFKNPNDENDSYDKHIEIWKLFGKDEIKEDEEGEKYIGEESNCSEDISFFSKRIQKFGKYSNLQQKYINFTYPPNDAEENELKKLSDDLSNDTLINIEDNYLYEKDGKKNLILGKSKLNFEYIYAKYLKLIEINKGYDIFIDILKNNPNIEEIYNIFFFLYKSIPYLHKQYFIENSELIKNVCINYINNLDDKTIRKLPKELNELVSNLIYHINSLINKDNDDNNGMNIYDEITLTFALKSIKTSIFDHRLKGIKDLNDIIEINSNKPEIINKIVTLIKDNKIINEVFGANYHSQLIKCSNKILTFLLKENALDENDITLIWSCTKRGDLEAKITILDLLSSIAENLKENQIDMLLNSVLSNVDKKISNEEIEFVFRLSTQNDKNEKNIIQCCEYLCQCYLQIHKQLIQTIKKFWKKLFLFRKKTKNI